MEGYKIMAQAYRKAAEEGKLTKEEAAKDCRIFDFLGDCSQEDVFKLFDSSAFNEIAKSYLRKAVSELIEEGTINEGQGKAVRNRFEMLFSEITAKAILEI